MKIYTIGFTGKNAETFFGLLKEHGVRTLVDIRLNNRSQLAGFTKAADLPYFLRAIGNIGYVYLPELAPDATLLKDYLEKNIDWDTYQIRFADLLKARKVNKLLRQKWSEWEQPICLLCSEPTPEQCHRRLVAERIAKLIKGTQVVHL